MFQHAGMGLSWLETRDASEFMKIEGGESIIN